MVGDATRIWPGVAIHLVGTNAFWEGKITKDGLTMKSNIIPRKSCKAGWLELLRGLHVCVLYWGLEISEREGFSYSLSGQPVPVLEIRVYRVVPGELPLNVVCAVV